MKLFVKNVGGIDRIARLVLGVLLLAAAYFVQADMLVRGILAVAGLAGLFTGALGTCTLYTILGISTNKK